MLPDYNCKTLVTLWGFDIRTWGVVQLIAVGLFVYLAYREARRLKVSIRPWIWMMVIGTVMAVLGMKLYNLFIVKYNGFWRAVIKLFTMKGGLDSAGGVLGIVSALAYLQKKRLNIGRYLDTLAFPGTVLVTIARVGCACALCETGTVTTVAWGLFYRDAIRHPIAMYYIVSGMILIGIFLILRKRRFWDGFLFTLFLLMYSLSRVLLDFYREIPAHNIGVFSPHQIAYLIISVSCATIIGFHHFRPLRRKV
jgi:phosphatidylglycerol---prolipoprotein diacylglyceryl transferase